MNMMIRLGKRGGWRKDDGEDILTVCVTKIGSLCGENKAEQTLSHHSINHRRRRCCEKSCVIKKSCYLHNVHLFCRRILDNTDHIHQEEKDHQVPLSHIPEKLCLPYGSVPHPIQHVHERPTNPIWNEEFHIRRRPVHHIPVPYLLRS